MIRRAPSTLPAACHEHGRVHAVLQRGDYPFAEGAKVVRCALAYLCPNCGQVLAYPHVSSGRIALVHDDHEPSITQEVLIPVGIEDLAIAVNTLFGCRPMVGILTLPVHLGLQVVRNELVPQTDWRIFDGDNSDVIATLQLAPFFHQRLEGLAHMWEATFPDVVRWLVVAAYDAAVLHGLEPVTQEVL